MRRDPSVQTNRNSGYSVTQAREFLEYHILPQGARPFRNSGRLVSGRERFSRSRGSSVVVLQQPVESLVTPNGTAARREVA